MGNELVAQDKFLINAKFFEKEILIKPRVGGTHTQKVHIECQGLHSRAEGWGHTLEL